jgi:tetratricopeptide (TPR) repeat protein
MHDAHAGKEADAAVDALVVEIPPSQRPTATVPDEIRAWAKFSQGDLTGAITLLRPIADRQAKIGKGEVELPAREMVAEMLLLSGNFAEALAEYQASLASDPNRFNALIGAGEAAQKLGRRALAARYHRILAADCAESDGAAHERVEKAKTL